MKKAVIVILLLLLAGGGAYMYGSNRAEEGREYASKVETAITTLVERFTEATKSEPDASAKAFARVAADAQATASGIAGAPAPAGAAALKRDSVKLVNAIGEMSGRMAQIGAYSTTLDRVGTVFSQSLPSDIKNMDDLAKQAGKTKKVAEDMAAELSKSDPPEAFKEYNARLMVVLHDLADALDGVIGAAEKGDFAAVTRQVGQLSEVEAQFNSVKVPANGELTSGVLGSESGKTFKSLSTTVEGQIVDLKEKTLTF